MNVIRAIVVPLSVAVLFALLWILCDNLTKNIPDGITNFICFIAILIPPPVLVATYGYKTGDMNTTILTGMIVVPLGFLLCLLFSFTAKDAYEIMVTFSILSMVIGSLEGYFSSKRRLKTTIILGIVWVLLIFPSFPISFIIF